MTESAPRQAWKLWFIIATVVIVGVLVAIAIAAATSSAQPHPAWGTDPNPALTQSP